MRAAVVALGKMGLPLAVQFARKGHQVVGVDVDQATVDMVNRGRAPFPGEARLDDYLADVVGSGALTATADYAAAVPTTEVVVVVVPLVVDADGVPDFEPLDSATHSIGDHLAADTLVVYETTLPVGTTRTRWRPMLEQRSGLTEGKDFQLAFSPERVLSGRVFADLRKYPKLVGGVSAAGGARAMDFYGSALDFDDRPDLHRANGVWDLGSAEAAEMAKLAETTYRDVNIGLANQFAQFAERSGIDVYQVIEASNSQHYSHIHRPGIAVGGHCIPVYPRLYLWNDPDATIVRTARETNAAMPAHAVARLRDLVGDLRGATVAVLGAAYRSGVKETAGSGVFAIAGALQGHGARTVVHDPLYSDDELSAIGLEPFHRGEPVDAAIVHTDHAEYASWCPDALPGVRAVVDGRNILPHASWNGCRMHTLGTASGW